MPHDSWTNRIFKALTGLIWRDALSVVQRYPWFDQGVALGLIPGTEWNHKFGRIPALPVNDWASIWSYGETNGSWIYPYRTTNLILPTLQSTDASDTQPITIIGIDADYNRVEITVTLNGLTPVAISTPIMMVERMRNDGSVDCIGNPYVSSEGIVYGEIYDGDNQSQMCIFAVPAGMTCLVTQAGASVGTGKEVLIQYRVRTIGGVFQVKKTLELVSGMYSEQLYTPFSIPEKSIIEARAITQTPSTPCSVWVNYILFDNTIWEL